ncbi:MAG: hypothetical protein PVSMB7_29350 [Chloroflexota bacterium]
MFGHMPELFIILIIALIAFGPDKLPEMAANIGKAVRDVRQAIDAMSHQEDYEVPEDFSTYYHESMARAGETPPDEEDQTIDDIALDEDDRRAIEAEDAASEHLEPIPFPADRPDVYPSPSELDALVPNPVDEAPPPVPSHTASEAVHKPGA